MMQRENQVPIARKLRWRRDVALCVIGCIVVAASAVVIQFRRANGDTGDMPTVAQLEREFGLRSYGWKAGRLAGRDLDECVLWLDMAAGIQGFRVFRDRDGEVVAYLGEWQEVPDGLSPVELDMWHQRNPWFAQTAQRTAAANGKFWDRYIKQVEQYTVSTERSPRGIETICKRGAAHGFDIDITHIVDYSKSGAGRDATITMCSIRGRKWWKYR